MNNGGGVNIPIYNYNLELQLSYLRLGLHLHLHLRLLLSLPSSLMRRCVGSANMLKYAQMSKLVNNTFWWRLHASEAR
jgi:hypothetical protein